MNSKFGFTGISLLFISAALTACGGGGGDGGAAPPPLEPKFWGTASLIETNDAGNATDPHIAIDASGNALAVWQQDGSIFANRYTAGSDWGTALPIETDNANVAQFSQIAINASGTALVVWRQSDGARYNIWANRFIAGTGAGTGWGTPMLIETDNAGDASVAQIAVDASGNALAVWSQSDGTRYNIWANRFIAGTGWGTATLIEANAGNAGDAEVAVDASGNALAVWRQWDGTRDSMWANRFIAGTGAGTGWGTAALIETDNVGNASGSPQIAIAANGDALTVWTHFDGTEHSIFANQYNASNNTWGTAALIETDNTGGAISPQIAVDASGNALAVWSQSDGTRYNIWANRFIAGTGWGTATLIETDSSDAVDAQVALDAGGNALAVWRQFDGTHYSIWANRFVAGTGWGTVALIESNAGDVRGPEIAIDANGNALAVWSQFDGTRNSIWANRYQ